MDTVEHWISRLSPASEKSARGYLRRWLTWLHDEGGPFQRYTPDQLVVYQQNADNGTRFDVLDHVQRYVTQLTVRMNTKRIAYTMVRSFFAHNRAELPRDPSFKLRGAKPKVRGRLTPEDVRKVVLSCDSCHAAAYLCLLQGGMGLEEFLYWNAHGYTALMAELRDDPRVVKVELPGRKGRKNAYSYYTFLGGDAITAIRAWLLHRPEGAMAIFTGRRGEPLSKNGLHIYWLRHLRTLGLAPPVKTGDVGHRTGRNLHELRDVFRSLWSKSPAKYEIGEFFLGHRIDPFEYDKSFRDVDFYRREYRKALPYLQIMSSGVPFGRVEQSEVEKLQDEVSDLKTQLQEVRTARRESDVVMDRLFEDAEFQAMIRKKMKELL